MTTLEGYELRRAVAEALGEPFRPIMTPEYDSDLNTVAEMPLPSNCRLILNIDLLSGECGATIIELGGWQTTEHAYVHASPPATAAWNAWLRLPDAVRQAALVAKENRDED